MSIGHISNKKRIHNISDSFKQTQAETHDRLNQTHLSDLIGYYEQRICIWRTFEISTQYCWLFGSSHTPKFCVMFILWAREDEFLFISLEYVSAAYNSRNSQQSVVKVVDYIWCLHCKKYIKCVDAQSAKTSARKDSRFKSWPKYFFQWIFSIIN